MTRPTPLTLGDRASIVWALAPGGRLRGTVTGCSDS